MKLCEVCHKAFSDKETVCPEHGERLAADALLKTTLGDYRVLERIREGGTAVLYSAEHVVTRQAVAIKVIKPSLASDENFAARFEREAQAVLRIGHPHLIKVLSIGKAPDGRVYYVRELLDGRSLATVMAASRLPMRVFAPMMLEVMDAVAAAHAAGILHGDLKPEHVFLVEKAGKPPFAKVLDFGYAAVPEAQAAGAGSAAFAGSVRYVAPEVLDGAVVDQRADVYALGVMLYELATGRPPFVADTAAEMREQLQTQAPPLLDGLRKHLAEGVPIEIEAVIFKALARDPADRYRNVRSLRSDLQRVIDGEVPDASPWWSLERQTKYLAARRLSTKDMPAIRSGAEVEALARGVEAKAKPEEVGLDTIRPVVVTPLPAAGPPTSDSTFLVQAEDATGAHASMMAGLQAAALELANAAAAASAAAPVQKVTEAAPERSAEPEAPAPAEMAVPAPEGDGKPPLGSSPEGAPAPPAALSLPEAVAPSASTREALGEAGLTTLPPIAAPSSQDEGFTSTLPSALGNVAAAVPQPADPVAQHEVASAASPAVAAPLPVVSPGGIASPNPTLHVLPPVFIAPAAEATRFPVAAIFAVAAAVLVGLLAWWFAKGH